jgi:uncharacterized protein with NRDE domain
MCTITYLPTPNGYITTQNRDESPLRERAVFPVRQSTSNSEIVFPKDPEGQGSWFVANKNGETLCIMNSVFHFDKTSADFKHSRGLVPFHYLQFNSVDQFKNNYEFDGIQGFTLVICAQTVIHEIEWDEKKVVHNKFEPKPLIFQSNPLYNPNQKKKRAQWFEYWLRDNPTDEILNFHTLQFEENKAESILMDREVVKTVSVVSREFSSKSDDLLYVETENLKNIQHFSIH